MLQEQSLAKEGEICDTLVIPSDPADADRAADAIEKILKDVKYEDGEVFSVKLAVIEALVNAIKHGNRLEREKRVTIHFQISRTRVAIEIIDEGHGFDPEDVPDPTAVENLERPCGRGLLLMRHYMDDVQFHPPGNKLTMMKERKNP